MKPAAKQTEKNIQKVADTVLARMQPCQEGMHFLITDLEKPKPKPLLSNNIFYFILIAIVLAYEFQSFTDF